MKWSAAVGAGVLVMGVAACGEDEMRTDGTPPPIASGRPQPQTSSPLPVPAVLPGEVTDSNGRVWRVRKITERAPADEGARPRRPTAPGPDYNSRTDEQLANDLRAVRLIGDLEYIEVWPDVERARLARRNNAAKKTLRGDPKDPKKSSDPDLGTVALRSEGFNPFDLKNEPSDRSRWRERAWWHETWAPLEEPRGRIGAEDRIWVDSIGQQFARAQVKFVYGSDFTGGYSAGCSGTMIGNKTAMTAGHCIFDTCVAPYCTTAWKPQMSWLIDTIKWRAAGSSGSYTTQWFYPTSGPVYECTIFGLPSYSVTITQVT